LSTGLLRLSGRGLDIGNLNVDEPVRRSLRIAVLCRRNSANEIIAILYMKIAGRIVLAFFYRPAEEAGIELGAAFRIRRAQVGPAECIVFTGYGHAYVPLGLPYGKDSARGIAQDGHASGIKNVKGRGQHSSSQPGGFGRSFVG